MPKLRVLFRLPVVPVLGFQEFQSGVQAARFKVVLIPISQHLQFLHNQLFRGYKISLTILKHHPGIMASRKASSLYNKLKVGPMKRLYKYYTPNAVNLAGGVPMESIFPFKKVTVDTNDNSFQLEAGSNLHLNYQRGDGILGLRNWIYDHVVRMHHPSIEFQTCMTVGSTDAFAKILLLLNGNSVIFDKFAYGTAVSACEALGRHAIGIDMDEEGMKPDSLREQVIIARKQGLNPDLVYLVPVAQNPTGISMSLQRKQDIYRVCSELDLVIVEDDAYYYLYFDEDGAHPSDSNEALSLQSMPGLDRLPKSFLSLDTDGRVLRIDSLSKTIAPGLRIGWISGPTDFVEKYQLFQELTSQFPSGLSQSAFLGLVTQWGEEGFENNIRQIQLHYRNQRDVMISALDSHFNKNPAEKSKSMVVTYNKPTAGMFIWLEIHNGPSSEDIFKKLAAAGVITVPAGSFVVKSLSADNNNSSVLGLNLGSPAFIEETDPPIVRLTYAASSAEQMRTGIQRLAEGLQLIHKEEENRFTVN